MSLTPAQLVTLRAAIDADATLNNLANNPDNNQAIADAFNAQASPAFWVYKTRLSRAEIFDAITWTELIGRSQGERDTLQVMLSEGQVNPASANVRGAFGDIFSGASGVNTRNALGVASRRTATRAEKLYATGTGSTASPATMAFEGRVDYQDVGYARSL